MPYKKNLYSISVIVLNPNQGGITADSKRMSCVHMQDILYIQSNYFLGLKEY